MPCNVSGKVKKKINAAAEGVACIILALGMTGCISVSWSNSGEDPGEAINYTAVGSEIFKDAAQRSGQLKHGSILLAESDPRYRRADELLNAVKAISEPNTGDFGDSFFSHRDAFQFYNETNVHLNIIVDDAPVAKTFPNGDMFLTTGIVDSNLRYAAKNDEQLTAVLCHELVHLRDGHLFSQWLNLKAHRHVLAKKIGSAFLKVVPIFSYAYNPRTDRDVPAEFDVLIEHAADYQALQLMKKRGTTPSALIDYLEIIKVYRKDHARSMSQQSSFYGWIDERSTALKHYVSPTHAIVVVKPVTGKGEARSYQLEAEHQYNLVLIAFMKMSTGDRSKLLVWLDHPETVSFDDAIKQMSASGRRVVGEYLAAALFRVLLGGFSQKS